MAKISNAWILPFGNHLQCAVSEKVMVQYIISPQMHLVPLTPDYCTYVINWRDRLIPVVNLAMLLDQSDTDTMHHIGIMAYQEAPRTPLQYGAIMLNASPTRIAVDDRQSCDIPGYVEPQMSSMILSCFSHNDIKTPIIDMSYLYSDEPQNHYTPRDHASYESNMDTLSRC
jgi:hypothetical protein